MKPVPRSAALLTTIVLVCAMAASIATLAWPGSFPSPSPAPAVNTVLAEARGWSAVTLLLVAPPTAIALGAALRGSLRWRLGWIGSLAYFVYTYLELAVSPPFTALYLLYVGAFACAVPALVMGTTSVDPDEEGEWSPAKDTHEGEERPKAAPMEEPEDFLSGLV